jgi:hypothetical protein
VGGLFEALAHGRFEGNGDVDVGFEAADAAGGRCDHFLGDLDGGVAEVQAMALGDDAEDGEDAGSQCGGDKVGGREQLALAHIVDGRVGGDEGTRGHVASGTVELAFVRDLDFDHGA